MMRSYSTLNVAPRPPHTSKLAIAAFLAAALPPALGAAAMIFGTETILDPLQDQLSLSVVICVPLATLLTGWLAILRIHRSEGLLRGGLLAILALGISAMTLIPMLILLLYRLNTAPAHY